MYAKQLTKYLEHSFRNNFPVLIKGAPGIGKSDIVTQATANVEYDLLICHPVVEDPTDAKGMPWVVNERATFLPFGNHEKMMNAKNPLVVFIDDLGQATPSMQAAYMQILLARELNGRKISDNVIFVAATNRREDRANVSGILLPVLSRFTGGIILLEVSKDDWVEWAIKNQMPSELISFIEWQPKMLNNFKATRDIENSPSPRTVAGVGDFLKSNPSEGFMFEGIAGRAGEAFAIEFQAFRKIRIKLPTIAQIESNPLGTPVPNEISEKYAMMGSLVDHLTNKNMPSLSQYINRLDTEIQVACYKNAALKNPQVCATHEFTLWASKNAPYLI